MISFILFSNISIINLLFSANCGDLLDLCNLLGSVPSVSEDDTNISDNESKKE